MRLTKIIVFVCTCFLELTPVLLSQTALAQTTSTGKFVVNFTITVDSNLPTTDKIACSVQAQVADVSSGHIILESASVAATRNGATASCSVTIPYSWTLSSASTDKVNLAYTITVPGVASAANALPSRFSSQSIATISVPANGSTTTETVSATI
jgi:hypothetical protein